MACGIMNKDFATYAMRAHPPHAKPAAGAIQSLSCNADGPMFNRCDASSFVHNHTAVQQTCLLSKA